MNHPLDLQLPRPRIRAPLLALAAATLLVGACSSAASGTSAATSTPASPGGAGGYGTGGYGTSPSSPASASASRAPSPSAPAASAVTLKTASSSSLGTYLTDGKGVTLYMFKNDTDGNPPTTACTGGCASIWPPLTVPAGATVAAASGVGGKITTFTRPDGTHQVAYNGIPLYYFSGDSGPGQTNGQGYGGLWYVVKA